MRKLGPIEQTKKNILKAERSRIRLKHSVAADDELNERLPELEASFDQAVNEGREFTYEAP